MSDNELKRGEFNSTKGDKVKLANLIPKGVRDDFTGLSLYGIVSKTPKNVFGFFANLFGKTQAPVILAHLDRVKPKPTKDGDLIIYCRKSDGTSFPVKITFDTDGKCIIEADNEVTIKTKDAKVECSGNSNVTCKNSVINCENHTINASSKISATSDSVDVGGGANEKALNGETTVQKHNIHSHFDGLGLPCTTPSTPMVEAEVLSTKVKVAK